MKIKRLNVFGAEGFGRVWFVPIVPGHIAVWERQTGPGCYATPRKVGVIGPDQSPSVKLARFFTRKGVAEDEGKDPYHYVDSNTDPKYEEKIQQTHHSPQRC